MEKICSKCGYKNLDGSLFCSECGTRLNEENPENSIAVSQETKILEKVADGICPSCGFKNPEESYVCINCGEQLVIEKNISSKEENKDCIKVCGGKTEQNQPRIHTENKKNASNKKVYSVKYGRQDNNVLNPVLYTDFKYPSLRYVAYIYKVIVGLIAIATAIMGAEIYEFTYNSYITGFFIFIMASICMFIYSNADKIKIQISQERRLEECAYYLKIIAQNSFKSDFNIEEKEEKR